MDLFDALHNRRAIRAYSESGVAANQIRSVIEAAVDAPSGMNRQPWSFIVVMDRPRLRLWSDHAKAFLLRSLDDQPELKPMESHLADPAFNIFYDAPALIAICATVPDAMAQQDCCLAAENLMLAAHGHGLATCWIGLSHAWLNSADGKDALALPPTMPVVAPIIIGHPKDGAPPKPHRNPAHISWIGG
ncbi:nitroreductase [Nitrospirillum sp. BR 11163]|uniref:nitroreductase family protein n=1 Tax=Nitrospirillum sp. BR 11163 TaxID=3104323 RepID=UPI002AFE0403|nr:nitroreductase [Nitrospirillum sp. BR 11163]MEA1671977.1 nitroreductase [Nitrospirillum sp. BR 11163]